METKKQKANKDFLPYVVVVVASYLLAVNLSAAIMVPFSQEAVSSFQEIELDSSSVASREADASQVNRIAQGADHLVAELLLVLLPIVFFCGLNVACVVVLFVAFQMQILVLAAWKLKEILGAWEEWALTSVLVSVHPIVWVVHIAIVVLLASFIWGV